jgi:Bacterial protein of unknown function (DUF899)
MSVAMSSATPQDASLASGLVNAAPWTGMRRRVQAAAGSSPQGWFRRNERSAGGSTVSTMAQTSMPGSESLRGDWPGISAFLQVDGEVYHAYSTFGRGIEEFHNGYPASTPPSSAARKRGKSPRDEPLPSGCKSADRTCASPVNTTTPSKQARAQGPRLRPRRVRRPGRPES